MRWYISVVAVLEWQRIAGYPAASDGPRFDDAAKELERLCEFAELKKDEGHRQIWQASVTLRGKASRIELTVATGPRPEGPLPQLVRVRHKTRGRK
jgi:hypothetical protein